MALDPLRVSVARRVRCPGTTAPPGETTTPTDGLLRSATSAGRPTQLLFSWRRRSTSSEREKPKVVTSPWKNEEATAHKRVRYRQLCCRGRSARAAGTRTHPADATRWFETPPRKTRVHPVKSQAVPLLEPEQKSASSPSCRARSGGGWGSVTRRLQACRCGPSPHAAGRRLPPALRVPLVAGLAVVRSHWIKACRASHERVCRRASCTVNSLELY